MTEANPETIAAVDLGSNSFHMIVARPSEDSFRVVDRMREAVRLAAGFDADNNLTRKSMDRALDCLGQFGERLQNLPSSAVRVVGTNTLRKARNSRDFIVRAQAALGHPIDVISGYEEARLIYLGVSHGLDDDADQRLVIDIGGGSTECIVGRRFDPLHMESLHMGCVSHSLAFFADGRINSRTFRAAILAARQELEPLEYRYQRLGWQSVIGASGTILAIREIVMQEGWSSEGITPQSLACLGDALVQAGHIERLNLRGLPDDRRAVLPGGVAILTAVFDALGLERMRVSVSALREGLLYDLLGRIHQEDVRERAVGELVRRYQIDSAHGERVAATALELLAHSAAPWGLGQEHQSLLRWAANLHEIGLSVSHSQYHKHGGYLLAHFDLPGFARGEQRRLATLVRGHRRKLPLTELHRLPREHFETVLRLIIVLRLAFLLHRRRSDDPLPDIDMSVDAATIKLNFPQHWLGRHPLTRADLESEAGYLKMAGHKLKFK